jgi:catechol 2,3-dioxygenase-like lactoylglutathione lyase family enzyme
LITAFQHVGLGVHDTNRSYEFYRKLMGFRVKLSDMTTYMEEMTPIIGALVELRALMAANLRGGAAIELIEHVSTRPQEPPQPVQWGDIGYLELGLKAFNLDQLYLDLKSRGVEFLTSVRSMEVSAGGRERYAYLHDPDGLLLQLVEEKGGRKPAVGGVRHVAIGVRDMEKARSFYRDVLGFSEVLHEYKGRMPELDDVTGGKEMELAVLGQQLNEKSLFAAVLDRAIIKLVHTPGYKGKVIYEGRRWGDIGLMEMAFDVRDLAGTMNGLIAEGAELYHPPTHVDMGSGTVGSFSYIKDPEGNVVEMVEVEKAMHAPPGIFKPVLDAVVKTAVALRLF